MMKNALALAVLILVAPLCAVPARAIPPPGMPQETIERVVVFANHAGFVWDVRFNKTNLRLTDDDGAATVAFAFWLLSTPAGEALHEDPTSLETWKATTVENWEAAGPWLRMGLDRLVAAYAGQSATQTELKAIRAALFPAGREIVTAPTYEELNALARWCDQNNKKHQYWVDVLDAQPHWPYPRHIKVKLSDNDTMKNPIGTALSGRTYELREGMIFHRYRTIFHPRWTEVLTFQPRTGRGDVRGELRALAATEVAAAHERALAQAVRVARFAVLHNEPVQAPALRGPSISTAVALETLAGLARGLDYSGTGDVDYWFRAATDLARTGRAIGKAIVTVGTAMPDDAIARLVRQTGAQLTKMQAAGTGDVNYWLATTKGLGDQLASAGAMLTQLAQAIAASTHGIPLGALLNAYATVARSVDASGTGNVDFWMRCTEHNAQVSRGVGKQLKAIAAVAAPETGPVLGAIAGLFAAVSASGSGTVDYWLARATATARQVRSHADTLAATAQQLDPAPERAE